MKDKDRYDISIDNATELYEEAILESRQELSKLGLGRVGRPKQKDGTYFNGHLPTGIHKASMSEISKVMTLLTVFADYVQGLAVEAKAEKKSAEETLKFIKAKIRKQKAGSKVDQDDATITDVRYIAANATYLTKLHSYEAIIAREESARRDIKTLSRLVSIEEATNEANKRSSSVVNKSSGKKRWR